MLLEKARGGEYGNAPYEMGDRYLRTILGFFGIKDIETIAVENLDVVGANIEERVEDGINKYNKGAGYIISKIKLTILMS
nr:NAD(P)H-dependent oxidoreductase [Clostridium gasigenes]